MAIQIASAASNVPRDNHFALNPVTGLYERALLLEGARTNAVLQSGDLSNAAWTKRGTAGVSGKPDPLGGTLGYEKIIGTVAVEDVYQSISGYGVSAALATAFWIRVVSAGTGQLRCANPNGAFFFDFTPPAVGATWTRIAGSFVATAGGLGGVHFLSANGSTWTVQLAAVNQEAVATVATSYIPTAGTSVLRNADTVSRPFPYAPMEMSLYVRFIEGGTVAESGTPRVITIASASDVPPALLLYSSGAKYTLYHHNGTSSVTSQQAGSASVGNLVELLGVLYADGSVQLTQSENAGAATVAARSAGAALAAAWSAPTIWLGSVNGTSSGFLALQSLKGKRGVQSLATMRAA